MAQKREMFWAFGSNAGLDFKSGVPVPVRTAFEGFGEAAASVTDKDGNLLFYTEGSRVWDRRHQLMPGGTNLTGIVSANSSSPTSSSSQGTLIVPMPATTDKYYVFSLTSMEQGASGNAGKLFYSVIDMSLNGGWGDVVDTVKGRLVAGFLSERLTAVVGNRCNLWIIVSGVDQRIRAFQITHGGVDTTPVISETGIAHDWTGRFSVSPDGTKLAASKCFVHLNGVLGLKLFDFDVNTGRASAPIQLMEPHGGYGVCFSPDNTKLYLYADLSIYQYDLSDPAPAAIQASELKLSEAGATDVKLGPDGKVYFRSNSYFGGGSSFGIIHSPNLRGAAAQVEQDAFRVLSGTDFDLGLPNIVPVFDFDLDTVYRKELVASSCFNPVALSAFDVQGWDYEWNDGHRGVGRSVLQPGVYWVKYFTHPCTYNVDTFEVVLPELQVSGSCANEATGMAWVAQRGDSPYSVRYEWHNASGALMGQRDTLRDAPPGNYELRYTSSEGCSGTISLVIPEDGFHADFAAPEYVCSGIPVRFDNLSGPETGTYVWLFGDGSSSPAEYAEHTYTVSGRYEVTLIKSGAFCRDTMIRMLTVDAPDTPRFEVPQASLCQHDQVELHIQSGSDAGDVTYTWDVNGTVMEHQGGAQFSFFAADTGSFPVSLYAVHRACPETVYTDTIRVERRPLVDLGPDRGVCPDDAARVVIGNIAADSGRYLRYTWSDGTSGKTLTVSEPGIYSLVVTGSTGCAAADSIEVRRACLVDIPNVFAPDGNGLNDYFFPRSLAATGITDLEFFIYNRWGMKVYATRDVHARGWDGRMNGAEQPQGVYVYSLVGNVPGKGVIRYQGNLTLIR